MDAVKRIRRSESAWRDILARRAASGMRDKDFCRAEGIHPTMLRRWQLRLAEGKRRKSRVRAVAKSAASPFIDIGEVAASRTPMQIRLDLGCGVVLSIVRG